MDGETAPAERTVQQKTQSGSELTRRPKECTVGINCLVMDDCSDNLLIGYDDCCKLGLGCTIEGPEHSPEYWVYLMALDIWVLSDPPEAAEAQ